MDCRSSVYSHAGQLGCTRVVRVALAFLVFCFGLTARQQTATAENAFSPASAYNTKSIADLMQDLGSASNDSQERAANALIERASADSELVIQALDGVLVEPKPKSKKVHEWAAYVLAKSEVGDDSTVRELLSLVKKGVNSYRFADADAPANAAWAIGRIGYVPVPDKEDVITNLVEAIDHGYVHLQEEAAFALGALASGLDKTWADVAIKALRRALRRSVDLRVRASAAGALGRFGSDADQAIFDLVQAALDPTAGPRNALGNAALKSIIDIVTAVRQTDDLALARVISENRNQLARQYRGSQSSLMRNALEAMNKTVTSITQRSLTYQLFSHWVWSLASGVILLYLTWSTLLRQIVLRKWPLSILRLYELMPQVSFQIPKTDSTVALSGIVTSWCHYDVRVLDEWVNLCTVKARNEINRLRERDHSSYVPLPANVNTQHVPEVRVQIFQLLSTENSWSVAILGDGGLGKTTLAYQFALWGLEPAKQQRLLAHILIPVVIELDYSNASANTNDIEETIQRQLKAFSSQGRAPSLEFCKALMRNRRLMLILDNASASFQQSLGQPFLDNINAFVCTSREPSKLSRSATTVIEPRYIENIALFRVVDHYLQVYKKELTMPEISQVAQKLQAIVRNTGYCTPLLANIFAQHLINLACDSKLGGDEPSIPDLFVEYVRFLNRNRKEYDDDDVYSAARIAASSCLRKEYVAGSASTSEVKLVLSNSSLNPDLLGHLDELGIIHPEGNNRFVFSIDTVAEYLAADDLVLRTNTKEDWRKFLLSVRKLRGGVSRIKEFLVAVRETVESRARLGEIKQPYPGLLNQLDQIINQIPSHESEGSQKQNRSARNASGASSH